MGDMLERKIEIFKKKSVQFEFPDQLPCTKNPYIYLD